MRKTQGPAATNTDPGRNVASGVIDAGIWTWPNPLDQLVQVLERAVARCKIRAASSDLTGN